MSTCDVFIDNIMPLYQLVRNFQVSNVIRSIMLDHQFIFLSLALCTFFCTLHQAEITIFCIEIGISITNVYLQSFFGWREKQFTHSTFQIQNFSSVSKYVILFLLRCSLRENKKFSSSFFLLNRQKFLIY